MQSLDLTKMASKCLAEIEALGLSFDALNDFTDIEAYLAELGKADITPKMSPSFNDFTRSNCCWFVMHEGGECCAVVGALFQDLQGEALSTFLLRSTNRQYSRYADGPVVGDVAGPDVLRISGKTAYLGELFVPEARRGRRKELRLFMFLVQSLVAMEWDVDHIYGFFRRRDALAKMPYLYGFTDYTPAVMQWNAKVEGRSSDECLTSVSRARLLHTAKIVSSVEDWLGVV